MKCKRISPDITASEVEVENPAVPEVRWAPQDIDVLDFAPILCLSLMRLPTQPKVTVIN